MMDSINQWLDPVEVRRLAERLMMPSSDQTSAFTDTNEAVDELCADVIPATSVEPVPEPAAPAVQNPLLLRLNDFRQWLRENHAATGIFILDHEGAVIFDENKHGRMHLLARGLALASGSGKTLTGPVRLKIGAKSTLEIIPIPSAIGHVVLGAVVEKDLSPSSVAQIMETFQHAVSLPGDA